MKQSLYILILFFIIACDNKDVNNSEITKKNIVDTVVSANLLEDSLIISPEIEKCNCKNFNSTKHFNHYYTDVRFDNQDYAKNKKDSIYNYYSRDSLKLLVKSIAFHYFDTIPDKYSIFRNVEHIIVDSRNNIYGLDMFPRLKSIVFWGSTITINSSEKWLNRIEFFRAEKSRIYGFESFKSTPNLKEIYLAHSKFDVFPADFNNLKCLRKITLGAYLGKLDLSLINLIYNPCIEKVNITTWNDSVKGIPQGLDTNKHFKIIISHPRLTKEEKAAIDFYVQNRKKLQNEF